MRNDTKNGKRNEKKRKIEEERREGDKMKITRCNEIGTRGG